MKKENKLVIMINEALKLITSNKTSTPVHNKNSVIIEINDFTKAIKLGTSTWTILIKFPELYFTCEEYPLFMYIE